MENDAPKPGRGEPSPQSQEKLRHRVFGPGEDFGNFKVVKCLCPGLIANYYRMQHIRDYHEVTIGVFHERAGQDTKLLKRLQVLQKTLKGFEHEGFPKIADCTVISGRACLFLEPVSGQPLSEYIERHARPGRQGLGPEETIRILAQLLGLLGYAHMHGIDHRDINSDMVLIQEDGSLRLLGLGIKAALGTELFEGIVSASVSPLASDQAQTRLDSFDVMSPEYKGGIPEDSRVDLYGAGAIGYWLLTGRKPSRTNPERPSSLVEGLLPEWDVLLKGLLEKDQAARFQSCRIALHALKAAEREPESERAGFVQRQIDRIPVPRRILIRGERATRAYRLSVIGVVGLSLCALASFFIHTLYTEEPKPLVDGIKLVAAGEKPQLVVDVRPPLATVEFYGLGKSFTSKNGRLELRLRPSEYKLRVSAPNHLDKLQTVVIDKMTKDVPVQISFELEPAWAKLQIRSVPGASVAVVDARADRIELGKTDSEGNFSLQEGLFAGKYEVLVEKEGFAPVALQEQELKAGEVAEIEAPLTPLLSRLTVRTRPPGARITLNDVERGRSPLVLDGIEPGEVYHIVARLENYRSQARRVELDPGQDKLVDLGELVPRSAELQLTADFEGLGEDEAKSLLAETRVVLGDRRYPLDSPDLKTLPVGEYSVYLEHPLYISAPETLTLADADVAQRSFTLTPRPAQVRLILPEGLEPRIHLNEAVIEWAGGPLSIPANQSVKLELRMENYLTMMKTFRLKPKETSEWEVRPKPIPGPVSGQDWAMPYLGFELAWIAPGSFRMGSPMQEQGRLPNEGEQTAVRFTQGFWAGIHEVTQSRFQETMDRMPSAFIGEQHPVDQVTWAEAQAFCRRLTAIERAAGRLPEGYVYRLPTEAEWEFAARAGTTTPFHFGEQADTTYGNFRGGYPRGLDAVPSPTETYGTEPVGSYAPNAFGLYDMHGNVGEWTLDAYNGRLPGGELIDPAPRRGGERYTVRGGSWEDFAVRVRSAARAAASAETGSNAIGFRIFLAPERSPEE